MVTQSQIDQIQSMLNTLVSSKADADAKTQAANDAVNAAKIADAAAAQANLDEAAADAKASADLSSLVSFVDSLASAPVAPAPVQNSAIVSVG